MKSTNDIIAAALDAALSPRPLNYTLAGLAETVVAALKANGNMVLGNSAIEGLCIPQPTPDVRAAAMALAAYDYADGSVEPCDPFVPTATFLVEALRDLGFAIVPVEPTATMLQGACAKHLPGRPMSATTPSWRGPAYDSDEECPAFVKRRRIYGDMIEKARAER